MRKLIVILILGVLGWQAYGKYQVHSQRDAPNQDTAEVGQSVSRPAVFTETADASRYRCDGRVHCSQMTSCAEATYFLKNCPGVKMDGDHDDIACEQQWCN